MSGPFRLLQAVVLAALLALVCLPAFEAFAQAPRSLAAEAASRASAADAEPASPEAVREMVSRLTDAQVRALLLERLDAVAQARAADEGVIAGLAMALGEAGGGLTDSVAGVVERVPNIPGGVAEGVGRFYEPRGPWGTLHLLAVLVLALAAGFLAERLLRAAAPRPALPGASATASPTASPTAPEPGLGRILGLLSHRLALEAAGAGVFILAAWAVMALLHPPEPISYLILTFFLFQPVIHARVAAAIGNFLLAPGQPALRLVPLDDRGARALHTTMVVFAGLVGLRAYCLSFLGGHGVDLGAMRLGFWLSLAISVWLLHQIWRRRGKLRRILRGGGDVTPAEAVAARVYPYAVMGTIVLFWALSETFAGLGLWGLLDGRLWITLVILILAPVLDVAIRGLARHLAPPGDAAVAGRLRRGLIRIGRVLAFGLILALMVDLWNIDFAMASEGPILVQAAARLIEAVAVLAVGYVAMEATALWVAHRLAAEAGPETAPGEDAGEGGGAGGSRLSTVLPLIGRGVQAGIGAVAVLVALAALGVSIAPLLAGVGIVGLAIGFGAQKLVADVVSGLFFLIDDAFRVGEYVEIDGTFGTVERISVRSLRLRHHEGAVHTIPFGEIPRLTNYSRDWVIMKLRFTVPFDTDLAKVKKLFKRIGQEMVEDPRFAGDFLQPFKSQGVLEVDDVGLVVRGKFMARPGRQWTLRKEIFARVQQVFEENAIQFARREVRVRFDGEGGPASEAGRRAVAGAAAEAASEAASGRDDGDIPEEARGGGAPG